MIGVSTVLWFGTAVITILAALALPRGALLALAICANAPGVNRSVSGPLLTSDVLLMVWLLRELVARRSASGLGFRREAWWVAWPIVATFVWAFVAAHVIGGETSAILRLLTYALLFFCLSTGPRLDVWFAVPLTAFAVFNVVGGIAQGQSRLVGVSIQDPSQLGGLLLCCLALVGVFRRLPLAMLAVATVLVLGIGLTQTRGVWFAALVVSILVIVKRRPSFVGLGVCIAACAYFGLGLVDRVTAALALNANSKEFRLETFSSGLDVIRSQPIFGSGWARTLTVDSFGELVAGTEQTVPFNLWIAVASFAGIPALILLVLFLIRLLRITRIAGSEYFFVAVFLAMSVSEMTFYANSLLTVLFFSVAGFGVARNLDARSKEEETVTPQQARGWSKKPI